ncbi:MAG: D-alanyl-D-alanine carboxypeptidase family protein [Verrucomicrobiota bacterium]
MLIRPGAEPELDEDSIDPGDPRAAEKKEILEWEKKLHEFSANLSDRQKEIAAREAEFALREQAVAAREAQLKDEEAAIAAREELIRAKETLPKVTRWKGSTAPSIYGKYAIVIDAANGRILHEKSARSATPVASTQKLLTALLICERGDLDKEIQIIKSDTQVEPSILGFKEGQSYTRAQLVKWLLVRSGNDVAKALARDHSGSVEEFCKAMTARARELGATNSIFKNANGLPHSGQHSTARDMALVAWECYHQPFIRECVKVVNWSLMLDHGEERYARNTNKLLYDSRYKVEGVNGMKTGYTIASGNCLITSAERDGRHRIVVVLKSTGSLVWPDSQKLMEWALSSD